LTCISHCLVFALNVYITFLDYKDNPVPIVLDAEKSCTKPFKKCWKIGEPKLATPEFPGLEPTRLEHTDNDGPPLEGTGSAAKSKKGKGLQNVCILYFSSMWLMFTCCLLGLCSCTKQQSSLHPERQGWKAIIFWIPGPYLLENHLLHFDLYFVPFKISDSLPFYSLFIYLYYFLSN
jgi:hypothetical protein